MAANHKQLMFDLLNKNGVEYKMLQHAETPMLDDSACVWGKDLSTGGKALVLKFCKAQESDTGFAIFVMSASHKLHTKTIKNEFKSKNVWFATKEELAELTSGLVPGSVPPFGRPIVDLDLFVDTSIAENEMIAFNCGSLTDSIVMSRADYIGVTVPTKVFSFSK